MARRRRLQQLTLYRNPDDSIHAVVAHVEVLITDPGPPIREGIDYEILELEWSKLPTALKQAFGDTQAETLAYIEELIPLDKVRTPTAVGTDALVQKTTGMTLGTAGNIG
jgi:hypothetical protein